MRKFTLCLMLLSAMFATAQDFANCYVTFTNVQQDGKEFVLYINDSNQLATSTDASVATEFLCTKEASGKYSFYNAEKGLYMIWRNNSDGGADGGDGTMAAYNATYCDWTLSPISGEDCYVVCSKRSNGTTDGSLILNHDTGVFDGWDSTASNRSDFSNHFRININSRVQFPEDGKAYVIKNVQNNGNVYVLQKGASALEVADVPAEITDAQIFVARVVDAETNKYAFVNAASGEYTMFHAISTTNPFSNGFSATFAYNESVECHFVVEYEGKILKNTFSLSGLRNRLTDANSGYATMAIGRDNKQMNANSGIGSAAYSDSYSSLFTFDEVEYANKPQLNNVGTSALITSDLHNKAMATFSAPFATVVPAGVAAYYAEDCGSYLQLQAVGEGAIPANTGVILVGDASGKVTMVPAASEIAATIEGSALSHSAGAAKEIAAGCYVLSAKEGVAGFYATTAGTIAMNKAYVESASGQNAIEIRLPGTTGIDQITENREQSTVIYDLTGRRIEAITSPGIYIVDGVKKLVR